MVETISVQELYRRVQHRPKRPHKYVVFTGFTGKVTRHAALMNYYRHEVWIPRSVMRATFMGEAYFHGIKELPDSFAEYEFSAPVEVVNDAKKYNEDRDQRAREHESRRYPT